MHLTADLSPEISFEVGKLEISKETEMLYYELMRALEEEETVGGGDFGFKLICLSFFSFKLYSVHPSFKTLHSH